MEGTTLLKQIFMAGAVLFCIGMTGCRDKIDGIYKGGEEEPEKVPNDFDYSTRKNVEINLQYDDVPVGYNIKFEMFTENPLSLNEAKDYVKDTMLVPFLEGYTDENGKLKASVDLPAYVKDIYVYSPSLSVSPLLHASVHGNVVSEFKPAEVESRSIRASRATTEVKYYTNWPRFNVELTRNHVNVIPSRTITADEMEIIDASLPIGSSPDITVNSTYQRDHFTLQDDATIELYFVSHNQSKRINSLAYFTYMGSIPTREKVNKQLILAYPADNNIEPGTGVQLKDAQGNTTFKKGTTLSFALLVDADGAQKNENIRVVYSEFSNTGVEHNFNHYNITKPSPAITKNRPHMVAFKLWEDADGNVLIGLGFEDQPWYGSPGSYNRGDFRDDIFIMKVTPKTAVPDVPNGENPVEPEYGLTFRTYGVLSFEDCWPSAGDYDLNDLVMKYEHSLNCRKGDMRVVSVDEKYTYLHNGAKYTNGFAYEMGGGMTRENIKSMEITTNNGYKCNSWGMDEDFEKVMVTLFDNSQQCPVGTEFNIHVVLRNAVDYFNFGILGIPYNPFIVVKGNNASDDFFKEGRTEVHLPKFAPTSKHDADLFGIEDDASSVLNKIYYVRNNESSYPFAIDLANASNFNSAETKPVDESYPDFIKWVKDHQLSEPSGKYDNWYK